MHESEKRSHGGKREGAGRKPVWGERRITTTINVTPELKAYFDQHSETQGDLIESTIRKTKDFKSWRDAKTGS